MFVCTKIKLLNRPSRHALTLSHTNSGGHWIRNIFLFTVWYNDIIISLYLLPALTDRKAGCWIFTCRSWSRHLLRGSLRDPDSAVATLKHHLRKALLHKLRSVLRVIIGLEYPGGLLHSSYYLCNWPNAMPWNRSPNMTLPPLHCVLRVVQIVDWMANVHFFISAKQVKIGFIDPKNSVPILYGADLQCSVFVSRF